MQYRILLSIILLSFFYGPAFSKAEKLPYQQYWTKANQYYNSKNYDSAVYFYEKIAATKPDNYELYFNLGNAYYRLNQIGKSILNYKKSLHYKPNNPKAEDNLMLAQMRVQTKRANAKEVFFIKWWESLTGPNLAKLWSVAALIVFLWIIGLLMRNYWQKKQYTPFTRGMVVTSVFLFLAMIFLAVFSTKNMAFSDEAVVIQSDALFKKELKKSSTENIPEGSIVHTGSQEGDWIEVTLQDGRQGWITISSIEKI